MEKKKTSQRKILLGGYNDRFDDFFEKDSCESFLSVFYEAYDKILDKRVCLKITLKEKLKKNNKGYLLNQLNIENDILKKCNSDYIIKYYNNFETDTSYILELEYFDDDLSEYITNEGNNIKKNKELFIQLIKSISSALSYLKENKIIHRDIKPSNIFMVKKENDENKYDIKLGNFFTATYIDNNRFEKIGTELFMAPEIARDQKYNEKCDIWSFGITLFYTYHSCSPIRDDISFSNIMDFYYKKTLPSFQTFYPSLDLLLKEKLLIFDSEKRISIEDLIKFISDENFMKEKLKEIDKKKEFKIEGKKEATGEEDKVEPLIVRVSRVKKAALEISTFDLNSHISEGLKYNNIIYFNTRYDKNDLENSCTLTIRRDSSNFANKTNGAFLTCIDSESLELLLKEIEIEFESNNNKNDDKNIEFNIITDDSCYTDLINILLDHQSLFGNCIKNICIYHIFSMNCDLKEQELTKDKNKIKVFLCENQKQVLKFIDNTSFDKIKPYPSIRLVNYQDYKSKFYSNHQKIAKFYGDIKEETFTEKIGQLKEFIDSNFNSKQKNNLKKDFEKMDPNRNDEDIKLIDETIIKLYKLNGIYKDMNHWLNNFDKSIYDIIVYFASRLMYSLNQYAINKSQSKFFEENKIIFRGIVMKYSSLLPYIINTKKIIIFSAFTSTSIHEEVAKYFSDRKEKNQKDYSFSVIFRITNKHEKNWISNGVDISEVRVNKNKNNEEKEVLFQPFSFYYLKNVNINLNDKIADIDLETIGKEEILETKIQIGGEIEYNRKLDIINIKGS